MEIFETIVFTLVGLAVFFGMVVLGVGLGRLTLDWAKKNDVPWQVQVTFLASIFAFLIAMAAHVHTALGGFGLGFGGAILAWGLPKKQKSDD
ncbi:MAG TPA: hypothetical protein VJZ78_01080 [Anaerolineales bacterium]|nr:hypothetical protein [Anaerolineales bacterium]